MKPLLLVICVVVLGATPALGQVAAGGNIGLYSDNPGFSDCYLTEALYVTNSIWVVHELLVESNTSQFMVVHNWTAVQGSVLYHGNLNLGEPYTGVTITYVGCKPLPHLLAELQWIPVAATAACTVSFQVVPDPSLASGQIEVVDCASQVRWATGGLLWVNGNAVDCLCGVATEETTWGKLKSLYR